MVQRYKFNEKFEIGSPYPTKNFGFSITIIVNFMLNFDPGLISGL
jgi:hypothetical protein